METSGLVIMATSISVTSFSSNFISSADGKFRFQLISCKQPPNFNFKRFRVQSLKQKSDQIETPDEVTTKYGLEAGLWKIFSSKEKGSKSKGNEAKELLAKYGGAYLATSITLSLISFSLCYALISAGIDVQALLHKIGISIDETGEKVGTFALAYAAHKAASPIRFPPTVALTPIVASWIGKKVENEK